jgi:hypothetical protein
MPLVDGTLSTRMIRFMEKELNYRSVSPSPDAQGAKHRVPIFAVSASLYEDSRFDYIQSGYVYPSHFSLQRKKPLSQSSDGG